MSAWRHVQSVHEWIDFTAQGEVRAWLEQQSNGGNGGTALYGHGGARGAHGGDSHDGDVQVV